MSLISCLSAHLTRLLPLWLAKKIPSSLQSQEFTLSHMLLPSEQVRWPYIGKSEVWRSDLKAEYFQTTWKYTLGPCWKVSWYYESTDEHSRQTGTVRNRANMTFISQPSASNAHLQGSAPDLHLNPPTEVNLLANRTSQILLSSVPYPTGVGRLRRRRTPRKDWRQLMEIRRCYWSAQEANANISPLFI